MESRNFSNSKRCMLTEKEMLRSLYNRERNEPMNNHFNTEESVVIEELSEQELEQVTGGCNTCADNQAFAKQWANRNNFMNVPAGFNNPASMGSNGSIPGLGALGF
jgi:bacteriocin-like protein